MKNKIKFYSLLYVVMLIAFSNRQNCMNDARITTKNFLELVRIYELKNELLALEAKREKTSADVVVINNLKNVLARHDQKIDDVIAKLKDTALVKDVHASMLQYVDESKKDSEEKKQTIAELINKNETESHVMIQIQALEEIKSARLSREHIKNAEKKLSHLGRLFCYIFAPASFR